MGRRPIHISRTDHGTSVETVVHAEHRHFSDIGHPVSIGSVTHDEGPTPHIDDSLQDPAVYAHRLELRRREEAVRTAIAREYRARGGDSVYGALGASQGALQAAEDGTWHQRFEFGTITVRSAPGNPDDLVPGTETYYVADVFLAAVKCFGTEDPGGLFTPARDEPYLIFTTIAPANIFLDSHSQPVVRTKRTPTYTEIPAGRVFGQNFLIFENVPIGPYGVGIKVLLMEHEYGDEAELEKAIADEGDKIAREAISIGSALAGIPVTEDMVDQALGSDIARAFGKLSVGALAAMLSDDKIAEKDWIIGGTMLRDWVNNHSVDDSYINFGLPASVDANYPRVDGPEMLFSGGGGSYKVYLRVLPKKVTIDHGGSTAHQG